MVHELFHTMKHKRGNKGLMVIKLDMEKPFDRIKWSFLLRILDNLGFHPTFVGWISQCISTPTFSILLNGCPLGKFHSCRGLWQGDPLSPFFFIIGLKFYHDFSLRRNAKEHLKISKYLELHVQYQTSREVLIKVASFALAHPKTIRPKSSIFFSKNTKP